MGYVVRKVLAAFATLLFVLTFNFLLFRVMPGDPVALLARSQRLTDADVEVVEQQVVVGSIPSVLAAEDARARRLGSRRRLCPRWHRRGQHEQRRRQRQRRGVPYRIRGQAVNRECHEFTA